MPVDYPAMTPDPAGILALAALLAGAALGLFGRTSWMKASGWVTAVAGLGWAAQIARTAGATAAALFAAVAVIAVLLVISDTRHRGHGHEPTTTAEPGPPDSFRDPRPGETPDGPADDTTHDPRWDEESPHLRMPGRARRPE